MKKSNIVVLEENIVISIVIQTIINEFIKNENDIAIFIKKCCEKQYFSERETEAIINLLREEQQTLY